MKYPFYHIIKDYFRYAKIERQSFFTLIFIAAIIFAISYIYSYQNNKAVSINYPKIEDFKDSSMGINLSKKTDYQTVKNIKLFKFDINSVSHSQLLKLGFTANAAKQYIKYRNIIGGFKKVEQLKKLYSMDDKMYKRLLPYATVVPQPMAEFADENKSYHKKDWKKDTFKKKKYISKYPQKAKFTGIIELNTCDTSDLKKLAGIGSYFAKSIIKEREKLGGFTHINQLKEIWGVKDRFETIKNNLTIDKSLVKTLNVNTAKYEQLWQHPYIHKGIAYKIIKEKYKGKFKNFEDFKKRMGDKIEKIDRLEGYLSF